MKNILKKTVNILGVSVPVWAIVVPTLVVAAVIFATWSLIVNVSEPLSLTGRISSINVYAGESYVNTLTIHNLADVDIPVDIGYAVISNVDGVVFDVSYESNPVDALAESDTDVDVTIDIDDSSPIGTLELEFSLVR